MTKWLHLIEFDISTMYYAGVTGEKGKSLSLPLPEEKGIVLVFLFFDMSKVLFFLKMVHVQDRQKRASFSRMMTG